MKQRESVYQAVMNNVEGFENGQDLTTEQRNAVHSEVFEGFKNGTVDLSESASAKYDTDAKMNSYVSGLISNWLRKDPRLNGGGKYTPKNPGSRAGQGDAQVRELRKLLKIHADDAEQTAKIQGYIDSRLDQIKSEKAKAVEIDVSQIPAELRDLISE